MLKGEIIQASLDRFLIYIYALLLHIRRATYQTYIWRNACIPLLNLPSPVENGGWKYEDDHLVQHLMTQDPEPKEIIELIV